MQIGEPHPGANDRAFNSQEREYFGDDRDKELNSNGWTIVFQPEDRGSLDLPEGTQSRMLEPDIHLDGRTDHILVFDPTKAEIKVVDHSQEGSRNSIEELKMGGWQSVDSNLGGSTFVKTLPKPLVAPHV